MSEADIRKYDPEDLELKGVMGDHFRDDTQPNRGKYEREVPKSAQPATAPQAPAFQPRMEESDDEWVPAKPAPDFMAKLSQCAKTAVVFGGLNGLLFYWQYMGLMDESIAMPSMCVCAALLGLGIGKVVGKK